jgi:hypothetical protein
MVGLICERCSDGIDGEYVEAKIKLKKTHQDDYLAKFTSYLCVDCAIDMDMVPAEWSREFNPGDQIAYIPDHAKGKLNHPATLFGFVAYVDTEQRVAWCRYWSKDDPTRLRTLSNSERTDFRHLLHHKTRTNAEIYALMRELGYKIDD